MGIHSINILPNKTNKVHVVDYLQLLGFKKITNDHLYYSDENNLEQVSDIVVNIFQDKKKQLNVQLSTTVWRSIFDHEIHNHSIKQLKLRFNGSFRTTRGVNRYLVYDSTPRRKSEAGCYLAYFHLTNNLSRVEYYLYTLQKEFRNDKIPIHEYHKPESTHTTIGLPFLVSILEEYLRSMTYAPLSINSKVEFPGIV